MKSREEGENRLGGLRQAFHKIGSYSVEMRWIEIRMEIILRKDAVSVFSYMKLLHN